MLRAEEGLRRDGAPSAVSLWSLLLTVSAGCNYNTRGQETMAIWSGDRHPNKNNSPIPFKDITKIQSHAYISNIALAPKFKWLLCCS